MCSPCYGSVFHQRDTYYIYVSQYFVMASSFQKHDKLLILSY